MNICMAGALGRMGRRILELTAADAELGIGGAFDLPEKAGESISVGHESGNASEIPLSVTATEALVEADVLIDFTIASVCMDNVRAAVEAGKAVVLGTTGLSEHDTKELEVLAHSVPIIFAPNFSVGVNLLFKLVGEAAAILGLNYNVEITETHHNQKVDSPSGTAQRLGERVSEALELSYADHAKHGREGMVGERPLKEIGMHALRGGDVAGEHTVAFIGQGESVELTHRAHNRDNFARGALIAAKFAIHAEPGLYDMQDVLGLK
ncbi:MAG: 4-hydroxy-tetrahydrodipicolinate reductase [Candidatus Hydrogenedentota bacterium]